MRIAVSAAMTVFEHYRMMRWIRERGSFMALSAVLFWLAGVLWVWRTDALKDGGRSDDESAAVEPRAPSASSGPAAVPLRRDVHSSPKAADAPEAPWKISGMLRSQIAQNPKADHHAVAVFKEGVAYRKVLRTIAETDLIVTSSDYEGSYRIGVVGSGQALESLASFPDVFRVDAR